MALHENLSADANLHFPKGFANASNNTYGVRQVAGTYEWFDREHLKRGIDLDSSITAPTTEVAGDIYLLGDESGTLTVSAINWQSGTTVRVTFSGSPDLSGYTVGDYLIVIAAGDADHIGTFQSTVINDGSDYIEFVNGNITDATQDETTGATGTITHDDYDGAPQNSWVRYDGVSWEYIVPNKGYICYLTTPNALYSFNGTDWVTATALYDTLAEILVGGNTSGGTDVVMTTGDTINFSNGAYTADITEPTLAASIVLTLPASTGTFALTSDATGIYGGSGSLSGVTVVTQAANTLAFTSSAVDGFSVDGTTFSVDASGNKVGIGTATPQAKLDVAGGDFLVDSASTTEFFLVDYSLDRIGINNDIADPKGTLDIKGADSLGTSYALVVQNGGNLPTMRVSNLYTTAFGQGHTHTSTIDACIHAKTQSGALTILGEVSSATVDANIKSLQSSSTLKNALVTAENSGGSLVSLASYGSAYATVAAFQDNQGVIYTNDFMFNVGNTNMATLTQAGDLGIGTATPAEKLDVVGNIQGSGSLLLTNAASFVTATTSGGLSLTASHASGFVKLSGGASSAFDLAAVTGNDFKIGTDGGGTAGKGFYFKAYNGSTFVDGLRYLNTASLNPELELIPTAGNIAVAGATIGTSGDGVLGIGIGTAPSTSPTDTAQMYVVDHNGAGTATTHIRNEEGDIFKMIKSSAYTLNATAVLDRTLLASASATTLNNNNALAALITDLKALGVLG